MGFGGKGPAGGRALVGQLGEGYWSTQPWPRRSLSPYVTAPGDKGPARMYRDGTLFSRWHLGCQKQDGINGLRCPEAPTPQGRARTTHVPTRCIHSHSIPFSPARESITKCNYSHMRYVFSSTQSKEMEALFLTFILSSSNCEMSTGLLASLC